MKSTQKMASSSSVPASMSSASSRVSAGIPKYQFKVALLGAPGTGKTTFLERQIKGEFTPKYIPTLENKDHPVTIHTDKGPVLFTVVDTSPHQILDIALTGTTPVSGVHAAILFCDASSFASLEQLNGYYLLCGNVPTVVVTMTPLPYMVPIMRIVR